MTLLPTEAMTDDGIDEERLDRLENSQFLRPRIPELFAPPLVLIKEHATLPMAFWDRSKLAYRDKIVGIHAPPEEHSKLIAVFEMLQARKRFYQFCCTVNGTQALVGKATAILKQDIDRLPMPDDPADLDLAYWEDALKEDVLCYMTDFVRLGQDSDLLKKAANEDDLRGYSSSHRAALFLRRQARRVVAGHGLRGYPPPTDLRPES
jgi:hypothetical protein